MGIATLPDASPTDVARGLRDSLPWIDHVSPSPLRVRCEGEIPGEPRTHVDGLATAAAALVDAGVPGLGPLTMDVYGR